MISNDTPVFYALQLYLAKGEVVVHDVMFDNSSEAKWLGEQMVKNGSVISYRVFPMKCSKSSYQRIQDYLRFSYGV